MVLLFFALDLPSLSPPLFEQVKQCLLELANLYALTSPLNRRNSDSSVHDNIGLCYLNKSANSPSSDEHLKVAYSPKGRGFNLHDFHYAINLLPSDPFFPSLLDDPGSFPFSGMNFSHLLSDEVLYCPGDREIERKIILITANLIGNMDSNVRNTLQDAADRCVSMEFVFLEQKSSQLIDISENIAKFKGQICDLENCSFNAYLPDSQVFNGMVKRWFRELKDDKEEYLEAHFVFQRNIAGSINQISCKLCNSINQLMDVSSTCKACRVDGFPWDGADGSKSMECPSCHVAKHDLALNDTEENSMKVGEHASLIQASWRSWMNLREVACAVNFDVTERTGLASLSEGVVVGRPYIIVPSLVQEINAAPEESEKCQLNNQRAFASNNLISSFQVILIILYLGYCYCHKAIWIPLYFISAQRGAFLLLWCLAYFSYHYHYHIVGLLFIFCVVVGVHYLPVFVIILHGRTMLAVAPIWLTMDGSNASRAPRVGHKKSRKGCAQCKRRHVKCNEESPCSNCVRHSVACSLAGGPNVPRDDAKPKQRSPATSISSQSTRHSSHDVTSSTTNNAARASSITSMTAGASPTESPGYSPIQTLTGSIDRNAALTNQAWILDLELMHHFTSSYSEIMTEHFDILETMWQHEMPRIAFRSQYVMHGLLGFSALHLATTQPERASLLRASATNHLDQALVFYRQDNGPATAENSDARFTFTWLVAMFAFAIPSSVSPINAMVELFSLVRGIEVVLQESLIWIIQGPFAPILTRAFVENKGLSADGSALSMAFAFQASTSHTNGIDCVSGEDLPEGMDFGLNHLDFMIGMHNMIPEERRTCVLVLTELKQLYAQMLSSQASCGMSMVMCFPKQDPTHFSLLLKRRVPQALIILAYYTVLLDLLDTRWWINGWGRRVLSDVVSNLGDEWKSWIDWPVQTVLMKPTIHQAASLSPGISLDAAMLG